MQLLMLLPRMLQGVVKLLYIIMWMTAHLGDVQTVKVQAPPSFSMCMRKPVGERGVHATLKAGSDTGMRLDT